eukprot:CAMPEP_0206063078 /NCGR_PEP_ID=MMETSP1466-20131121/58047_1 /ASSEMBLY_ACC=CAM_ASM_001126 /TAXON_ID=44452 /ORGANISM="Pavlova gyrans, Strain CCMP608" /LENGTH=880 /DNA_ID=CAMNT_0053438447 /DNA_START=101 /DNA_END=2742 /DNA_ORIENTATION=-
MGKLLTKSRARAAGSTCPPAKGTAAGAFGRVAPTVSQRDAAARGETPARAAAAETARASGADVASGASPRAAITADSTHAQAFTKTMLALRTKDRVSAKDLRAFVVACPPPWSREASDEPSAKAASAAGADTPGGADTLGVEGVKEWLAWRAAAKEGAADAAAAPPRPSRRSRRSRPAPSPGFEAFLRALGDDLGCWISDASTRGILLRQIKAIYDEARRRCVEEGWTDSRTGLPIHPDEINLYHLEEHLIRRATAAAQCSMVELVAPGPQAAAWFVSHWWGETVADFIACLERFCLDKGIDPESDAAVFWVCAYALNQHDLGAELAAGPEAGPFVRALALADGAVSIVDARGVCFTRVWCSLELFHALVYAPPGFEHHAVTQLKKEVEYFRGHRKAREVCLLEGFAEEDDGYSMFKQDREAVFPRALLQRAGSFSLARAEASRAEDLANIREQVGDGERALDATVRARFAVPLLADALVQGDGVFYKLTKLARWAACKPGVLEALLVDLRDSRLRKLSLDLGGKATAAAMAQLGAALPETLADLRFLGAPSAVAGPAAELLAAASSSTSNICLFKETDCSDSNKTCEATYTGGRLYGSFGLACEEAKCDDTARCQARFSLPNGTLTAGPDGYNQPQACASRSTDSATGACTNTDIEPGTPCAGACSGYRMSCACSADVFSLGLLGTCQRMPCDEEFVRLRTCKEKLYYVAASYDEFTCGEQAAGYYECLRNSQGLGFAGAATSRLSKIAVTALVFSTLLMTLVVEIGADGARALAEALPRNQALQTLNLGRNEIGDDGARALAEALLRNQALQALDLDGNWNIGSEAEAALREAWASSTLADGTRRSPPELDVEDDGHGGCGGKSSPSAPAAAAGTAAR